MYYILPYKMGSASAKLLSAKLEGLRIKGTKILPRNPVLINWGRSELPMLRVRGGAYTLLNNPQAVAKARDKRLALAAWKQAGLSTPDFTTNMREAASWRNEDTILYGRHVVSGQEGRGIQIISAEDDMVHCPLYTKGVTKAFEYRVHVVRGSVIDFAKKKRRQGNSDVGLIKNSANGWVFCRQGEELPNMVAQAAVDAVAVLGLDFAALDILYKQRDNKYYILEANTAPGIEGTTLNKYTEAFRSVR